MILIHKSQKIVIQQTLVFGYIRFTSLVLIFLRVEFRETNVFSWKHFVDFSLSFP